MAAVAGNPSRIFVFEDFTVGANSPTPVVLLEALVLGGTELFCVSNSVKTGLVVVQHPGGINGTISNLT